MTKAELKAEIEELKARLLRVGDSAGDVRKAVLAMLRACAPVYLHQGMLDAVNDYLPDHLRSSVEGEIEELETDRRAGLRRIVRHTIEHRMRYMEMISLVEFAVLSGRPIHSAESFRPGKDGHLPIDPLDEILAVASLGKHFKSELSEDVLDEVIRLIESSYAGVAVETGDGIECFEPPGGKTDG